MQTDNRLGRRIRSLREASGLAQEDLGHLAGVRGATISRIERGEVQPSTRTLRGLATALKTPIAAFFEEAS